MLIFFAKNQKKHIFSPTITPAELLTNMKPVLFNYVFKMIFIIFVTDLIIEYSLTHIHQAIGLR